MEELEAYFRRIIENANEVDRLSNGAALGATGGTIVLGVVFGGIFWLPAGICIPIAIYKLCAIYSKFYQKQLRAQNELTLKEKAIERQQLIEQEMSKQAYYQLEERKNTELLELFDELEERKTRIFESEFSDDEKETALKQLNTIWEKQVVSKIEKKDPKINKKLLPSVKSENDNP